MFEKFRQKTYPRFHLRSRLDDYSNWKAKGYWGAGSELEGKDHRSLLEIFPLSALKEMHSFLLFKVTLAFSVILIVFLLSLINFPFSRTIVENIHYVTTWKTDFVDTWHQAAPVVRRVWEGSPERGMEVLAPPGEKNNGQNDSFQLSLPLEGRVVKNFGYGFNPALQMEEMTYGVVFSTSGDRDVYAPAPGRVGEIKDDSQYGLFVIVQHTGGKETCYGYLREVYVNKGQEIQRGFPIARAGLDPEGRDSFLYFEVRDKGEPVDPLPFFTEQPLP